MKEKRGVELDKIDTGIREFVAVPHPAYFITEERTIRHLLDCVSSESTGQRVALGDALPVNRLISGGTNLAEADRQFYKLRIAAESDPGRGKTSRPLLE